MIERTKINRTKQFILNRISLLNCEIEEARQMITISGNHGDIFKELDIESINKKSIKSLSSVLTFIDSL